MQRLTRKHLFWNRGDLTTVPAEPPLRVALGETFEIETIDTADRHPQTEEEQAHKPNGPMGGNPNTGPVYVEGVRAGDVIAVHIEHLELASQMWCAKVVDGQAVFPGGFSAPLRPMYGCFGVVPSEVRPNSEPGHHGGNMDIPDICVGSIVHVRAERDGAYFCCGDGHALQGEGEINGYSLEVSLNGRLRIERSPFQTLKTMLIETPEQFITVGIELTAKESITSAIDAMAALLAERRGAEFKDARYFVSHVGDIRLGAAWPGFDHQYIAVPFCLHLNRRHFN